MGATNSFVDFIGVFESVVVRYRFYISLSGATNRLRFSMREI
jgi:hypothetical protein